MAFIRWLLGKIILFLDATFSPKPALHDPAKQAQPDQETRNLVLYQFEPCPFCVKVRRAIRRMGLKIELRDAQEEAIAKELVKGGGQRQVPCLRITEPDGSVRWMYESSDIIEYLQRKFTA